MKEHFKGSFGKNAKALEEISLNQHDSDLFDQNEDKAGELYDLATGKRIDNSGPKGLHEELTVIENGGKDALPPLPEEDDEAAKWLRANGG